ncbi:hypothetical protein Q3G72_023475 [Acer saccharum]|nr:hypothetical protein Q3G72_023475 [Acer saccharum]
MSQAFANVSSYVIGKLDAPSIVFEQEDGQHGGNKLLISFQTSQIRKLVNHLGRSFFLSRLFDLEVRPEFASGDVIEKVRVLPRLELSEEEKQVRKRTITALYLVGLFEDTNLCAIHTKRVTIMHSCPRISSWLGESGVSVLKRRGKCPESMEDMFFLRCWLGFR